MPYYIHKVLPTGATREAICLAFEANDKPTDLDLILEVDSLDSAFLQIRILSRLLGIEWLEGNRHYWLQENIERKNRFTQLKKEMGK